MRRKSGHVDLIDKGSGVGHKSVMSNSKGGLDAPHEPVAAFGQQDVGFADLYVGRRSR